jgi:UDP-N-acetylmuramate dehydrogenase
MNAIEDGVRLAKLTTIGTGGAARAFARPRTVPELVFALRHARDEGLDVIAIGLGSNVLAADEGVDALVVRLEGELASASVTDGVLVAGGGATNAVCLHRARKAGLGGFEFACAIPGTAGGGVFMNAGAYGSDWSDVLVRALVVSADGEDWRTPSQLGLEYRHSALAPGEVVARVEYSLTPRPPEDIRATVPTSLPVERTRSRRTSARSEASSRTHPARSARGGCSSFAG